MHSGDQFCLKRVEGQRENAMDFKANSLSLGESL